MKYNDEIIQEICKYIEAGNNNEDTSALVGIDDATFYRWKKEKNEFCEAIKKAEKRCKARNIAIIQKAAAKSWTAAAWWLERKYSDEFALKTKQEISGDKARPVVIKLVEACLTPAGGYASSSAGSITRPNKVQSISMAQTGKKDDNSTRKDSK